MSVPSYIKLYEKGDLQHRVQKALSMLEDCRLCPRTCGINRLQGEIGYCKTGRYAKVAGCNAHFGEEAPLVGKNGSGTLFLSSCNLLCTFCQNDDISHHNKGVEVDLDRMAGMMVHLSRRGCHNINFVTPTHVVPQILEALVPAIEQGLSIPLVYNAGGYESVETLALLEGIFDIYMPDFKFWDNNMGGRFCNVSDYREKAIMGVKEMHRQVGDLLIDADGLAVRGLLVRHLVMPNRVAGTEKIVTFLANEISTNTYLNLMDQYRPCGAAEADTLIDRMITAGEFQQALDRAEEAGLKRLDKRRFSARILRMVLGQ
jgi:putative pyruvate formate lyase activating enzyme